MGVGGGWHGVTPSGPMEANRGQGPCPCSREGASWGWQTERQFVHYIKMSMNACLPLVVMAKCVMCCVIIHCGLVLRDTTVVPSPLRYYLVPQVLQFFSTVLVRCWHTVTKTALYLDWNCKLRLVFCRSPLNCTRFTYIFYNVLFYSVYQISEMTPLRQ